MTTIVWDELAFCPAESMANIVAVKEPADVYVWTVVFPLAVDPSPNFQLSAYGDVPPVALPLNVTGPCA